MLRIPLLVLFGITFSGPLAVQAVDCDDEVEQVVDACEDIESDMQDEVDEAKEALKDGRKSTTVTGTALKVKSALRMQAKAYRQFVKSCRREMTNVPKKCRSHEDYKDLVEQTKDADKDSKEAERSAARVATFSGSDSEDDSEDDDENDSVAMPKRDASGGTSQNGSPSQPTTASGNGAAAPGNSAMDAVTKSLMQALTALQQAPQAQPVSAIPPPTKPEGNTIACQLNPRGAGCGENGSTPSRSDQKEVLSQPGKMKSPLPSTKSPGPGLAAAPALNPASAKADSETARVNNGAGDLAAPARRSGSGISFQGSGGPPGQGAPANGASFSGGKVANEASQQSTSSSPGFFGGTGVSYRNIRLPEPPKTRPESSTRFRENSKGMPLQTGNLLNSARYAKSVHDRYAERKPRSPAGSDQTGADGITGSHTDLWKKVRIRYQELATTFAN